MKYGSMTHDFTGRKIKKKAPMGETFKKFKAPAFKDRTPMASYRRDAGVTYKSVDIGSPTVCAAPEKKEYTGTLVKGIATMHKSNAVPVIDQEQATDIANMRRG